MLLVDYGDIASQGGLIWAEPEAGDDAAEG